MYRKTKKKKKLIGSFSALGEITHMKRSRVRVTIEEQCVLSQISLQIKMFEFLLNSQNHRMNHIFPGIYMDIATSRPNWPSGPIW